MADETIRSVASEKIIGGLFALVGLTVILGVSVWTFQTRQFVKNASSAKGKVIALNAGGSHPQIKFTTGENQTIEYAQNGLIGGYRVGDEATVLYDPQNPRNACVDTFGALWGFNAFGFVLGIVFIVVGCFKFIYAQR